MSYSDLDKTEKNVVFVPVKAADPGVNDEAMISHSKTDSRHLHWPGQLRPSVG